MEDDLIFFLKNQNDDLKHIEDYLKKNKKTEDDLKKNEEKNGRRPKKK